MSDDASLYGRIFLSGRMSGDKKIPNPSVKPLKTVTLMKQSGQ
jgi:hypothetical protein